MIKRCNSSLVLDNIKPLLNFDGRRGRERERERERERAPHCFRSWLYSKTGFKCLHILISHMTHVSLRRYLSTDDFNTMGEEGFENIVRKEENAGNQHFLLFPQYLKKKNR